MTAKIRGEREKERKKERKKELTIYQVKGSPTPTKYNGFVES